MKEKYLIQIRGERDSTFLYMELTEEEKQLVERLEFLSIQVANQRGMPTIHIKERQ